MKTPAIIASLTVIGSIAFAAGQQSGGKQSPPMPSGAQAHSMQEEMPQAQKSDASSSENLQRGDQSGTCTIFDTASPEGLWFTHAHTLPPCFATFFPPEAPISPWRSTADANADGKPDTLIAMFQIGESCAWRYSNGNGSEPLYLCNFSVLWLLQTTMTGDQTFASLKPAFTLATIYSYLAGRGDESPIADYQIVDLIDMDNDGDLDLVVRASTFSAQYLLWIENTSSGSQSLAADLNGDGQVNGADLGLLLVAWGPNP